MVVRVDTTNLERGLDFSLVIHANKEPKVSLYAFNTATYDLEELSTKIVQDGVFYKALSKAPYFDGFLLAKINSKSMVVKKIGHPRPHFVIAYKENYTVPYKIFNKSGVEINAGNLKNIIDGFYYCEISSDVTVMETLKKRFIMKENFTKLDYEVKMGSAEIDNVDLPSYKLDATLQDVTLPDVKLAETNVKVSLPTVQIKG